MALAVLAPVVVGLVQQSRLDRAQEQVASLQQELDDLRDDDVDGSDGDGGDGSPTDAPSAPDSGGADGDGGASGGGGDPLDDLLGGGAIGPELIECLAPAGGGPLGGGGLGGDIDGDTPQEQIDQIERLVIEERALEPRGEIEPEFLSSEAIADRVEELIAEEYTPELADADGRILAALGAVRPGTDLAALQRELLAGQVVGFYDPDTGELVVEQARGELDGITKTTLAHELGHAIVDQAIGLPEAATAETGVGDADASLAAAALVEGDASLLMQRFALSHLSVVEQLGMAGQAAGPEAEALARAPSFVRDQLIFPYLTGLEFVCALFRDGGWDAVDRAYEDPPDSTAEVLFPDRYRAGEDPVAPAAPSAPGPGWTQARSDSIGAADLLALFRAPGDDTTAALSAPRERAGAWNGGTLVLWTRGDDTAVGVRLESRDGADPHLCRSMRAWYRAAFPEAEQIALAGAELALDGARQDAVLTCEGATVTLGIAPDATAAARIADA